MVLWRPTRPSAAKSLQSCPTLGDPRDSSPPGSPVPGILQARTLEWVAISFSNAWKWKVKVKSLSRVRLFATPWTAAYQAPLSMAFSRQEYWSGVPSPSPTVALVGQYFHCPSRGGRCKLSMPRSQSTWAGPRTVRLNLRWPVQPHLREWPTCLSACPLILLTT